MGTMVGRCSVCKKKRRFDNSKAARVCKLCAPPGVDQVDLKLRNKPLGYMKGRSRRDPPVYGPEQRAQEKANKQARKRREKDAFREKEARRRAGESR